MTEVKEPSPIIEVNGNTLYLGSIIAAQNGLLMQELNIGLVVNCAEEISNFFEESSEVFAYQTKYINCSIKDEPDVDLAVHFKQLLPKIHESLTDEGMSVLVHCSQGISRSVTVVLSYLMQYHKMNLKDSLSYARERRAIIRPNFGFFVQLSNFERTMYIRSISLLDYIFDYFEEYWFKKMSSVRTALKKERLSQNILQIIQESGNDMVQLQERLFDLE